MNYEFKGIKGPWRVIINDDQYKAYITTIENCPNVICELEYGPEYTNYDDQESVLESIRLQEELEANAHLIASAPDLLEACKKVLSLEDLWYPAYVTIGQEDEAISLQCMKSIVRNAIEKALNINQ